MSTSKEKPKDSKKSGSESRNFRQLSNVEHVRHRTGMWLGQNSVSTFEQHFIEPKGKKGYVITHEEIQEIPAKLKCLDEAVINAVDVFNRNQNDSKIPKARKMSTLEVAFSDDMKRVTISDDGRGIPAANAEGVFLHLMYGENFDDEVKRDHVAGQNGVGISLVRIVSKFFKVVTHNQNTSYHKTFSVTDAFLKELHRLKFSQAEIDDFVKHYDEHATLPFDKIEKSKIASIKAIMEKTGMAEEIKKNPSKFHGTQVTFELDPKYFQKVEVAYDLRLTTQYLQDIAMTNPGLTVVLKHKKEKKSFLFENGVSDLFSGSDSPQYRLFYKNAAIGLEWESFILPESGKSLTWVNSNFASLGGSPIEYLENRICDEVRKKPAITAHEKRLNTTSTRNDVRNCFHMVNVVRMLNPRFRSQDKSYLINDLNEDIRKAVDQHLDRVIRALDLVTEVKIQMEKRTKLKELDEAARDLRKAGRMVIPKLIPATGKSDEPGRTLFLAEGDSAIAGLRPARDPKTHALFPLRGKPLNVKGMSLAKAIQNEEMKNLVSIVNLPLNGQVQSKEELNYEKICIITDADYDGYAIRSLMISFFYEYWPELFKMGVIHMASAPLYEVEVANPDKKRKTFFCIDDNEFDALVKKIKLSGSTMIRKKRNKGLGETGKEAMRFTVENCVSKVEIKNAKEAEKTQDLWFHKDYAEERRKAISAYAQLFFES